MSGAVIRVRELMHAGEAELTTGPFGTQLKAAEYVADGIPVINVRNVGFGGIRTDADLAYVDTQTAERLSRHLLRCDDIVFGRKGAVERHAYITEHGEGWLQGSDCLRLRLDSPRVLPRFASYCLLTERHMRWMQNQCSHGATMASLNQDIISRIELPLPPIQDQRKIVAVLSGYDDLIENNRRRLLLLEEMAQRIYREWFVDFRYPGHESVPLVESEVGRIPQGWPVTCVREVASCVRGRSYRGTDLVDAGGRPFINLKCVNRDGGFRPEGVKRYAGPYAPAQAVRAGDTVVAVTDMTQERRIVARAARVPPLDQEHGVISMDLVKIVPKQRVPPDYLLALLRFSSFPDAVKHHANGANVLHLHPDRIGDYRFPCPPHALMERYATIACGLYSEGDILGQAQERLAESRDLLLPRLVSGEIDMGDLDISVEEAVP